MRSLAKTACAVAALSRRLATFSALLVLAAVTTSSGEQLSKTRGRFIRSYWYERGIEHGNPYFDGRFRVNAPEVVLHPSFMHRTEVRENGMMLVLIEENLSLLSGAELYLELWGGHPGTANKRVTVNGRSTYSLPEVGTAAENCTHSYPTIPLKITDLVNGYNAVQFACDQGTSFWGHFIVDNASLRAVLKDDHPDLKKAGLADFEAGVVAHPKIEGREAFPIELSVPSSMQNRIASVDFWGCYYGYDENGNRDFSDWHGFTKNRLPQGILGTSTAPPFSIDWDTSMLPGQKGIGVKAIVRFKDHPQISYETPVARVEEPIGRRKSKVSLYTSKDIPRPFWSRASEGNECTIVIDEDPERIEKAELHVVIWDGGRGKTENPFTLNGHPLAVAGKGHHDVLYRKIGVDPEILKRGPNRIVVLSDTEHHGIEILLPGPALVIRSRL